jgi:hypothetical protein
MEILACRQATRGNRITRNEGHQNGETAEREEADEDSSYTQARAELSTLY